ncbi:MAG: hypothetical protein O3B47_03170 [bacterium]|nr:hypothetical protein [bacterium]
MSSGLSSVPGGSSVAETLAAIGVHDGGREIRELGEEPQVAFGPGMDDFDRSALRLISEACHDERVEGGEMTVVAWLAEKTRIPALAMRLSADTAERVRESLAGLLRLADAEPWEVYGGTD